MLQYCTALYEEAEVAFRRALEVSEEQLAAGHPNTLTA